MDTIESQPHKLTLTWTNASGTRETSIEFPHRPTEAELGLKLAQFFSVDNFRLDENLREIHECVLVEPDSSAQV